MKLNKCEIISGKCCFEKVLQLHLMLVSEASSGGSVDGSASVGNLSFFVTFKLEVGAHAGLDEGPGTTVLWLFLRPTLFGVGEALSSLSDRFEGERSDLLDSDDRDVVVSLFLTLGLQVVVHLTTAVHDLSDLRVSNEASVLVFNDFVESKAFTEVFQVRVTSSEFQQEFRGHDDQGLAESSSHLST